MLSKFLLITVFITKCDKKMHNLFLDRFEKICFKAWQLLQSATKGYHKCDELTEARFLRKKLGQILKLQIKHLHM